MGAIETAVAALAPGQSANDIIPLPEGGFKVRPPSGGAYDITDWTPRCHWDAARKQLILIGKRKIIRALAWSDTLAAWRDMPLPTAWTTAEKTGHWYGWGAHDGADRIYAGDHVLRLDTDSFEPLPPPPSSVNLTGSNGTMYAWMGDRLARYGSSRQFFVTFDPATQSWPLAVQWCNHGQHALVEYHPAHQSVLVVGGNVEDLRTPTGAYVLNPDGTRVKTSSRRASIITKTGVVTQVADIPEVVSMSSGSWIVPHSAGCWIVRSHLSATAANLWAYWPQTDAWQALGPSPDQLLKYPTAALMPDDVLLIAHRVGVMAFRLPAL